MKFSQTCINRPVFTSVLALILILVGVIAFMELPVRFSPFYFRPVLLVTTNASGASAEYVEENITTPLEQSLSGTPGLDLMMSRSMQGESFIMLNFKNLSEQQFVTAQSQVLQEISGVQLPELADRPQVMQRSDSNEVMLLGATDSKIPQTELVNYINNYLVPRLTQVSGVAQAQVYADTPNLRITLNPQKMASLKISVDDVKNAVNKSNTSIPLGSLLTDEQALTLNSEMFVPDIAGFENLVVAKKGTRLVYLKDIASIGLDYDSLNHYYSYINGRVGVPIKIDATDDANPIQVGEQVKALIQEMQPNFPQGFSITHIFDLSNPLQQAVNEVYITIFIAIILVFLVTLAFLGNLRATFIPIVTIPVCLIAAFSIMLLLGFTINTMTLLALVLGVGLVVDDAIVVLENTFRHMEMGESPLIAAKKSIEEISFAVLGITVCLIAVYLPAAFLPSSINTIYFQEFAFTLAGAIVISGFLALTLSPMMCSKLLKQHAHKGYEEKLDKFMLQLSKRYEQTLSWVMHHPKTILSILIANLCLGVLFFNLLPSDLLPKSELEYIQGGFTGPNSASTEYTDQQITNLRMNLQNDPHYSNTLFFINPNGFVFFMGQVKSGDPDKLAAQINNKITQMPNFSGGVSGVDANSNQSSSRPGNLFFYVTGIASFEQIANVASKMQQVLTKDPAFSFAYDNVKFSQQQYNLMINRNIATMLGVDLGVLNDTLATFLGGYTFPQTTYQVGGYGYPITMQLSRDNLKDINVLQNLYVENSSGQLIPSSSMITVTPSFELPTRMHVNQLRAGEVDISPSSGYSNGELINEVQAEASQVLPQGMQIAWGGQGRNLIQNSASGNIFILLGLVFIYLVLAALFESFIDPLIILCTVPLCIVAGLIGLYLIGGSINIYTKIALVTLIGLVAKHGVLITQFANQLRSEGLEPYEAVTKAALIRLRPILMTSLTMILGAIPLLLAFGTDSTGRAQIGAIIVLGLLLGSFFSLFIVPVAYLVIGKFKKKFRF